jgi:alpha-methylacyl-CoA racemase
MTSSSSGPLQGVRVVELVGIGPAPFACRLLSDLGAEVLAVDRIEGARTGDAALDGRPRMLVDLKTDQGRRQVLDAVASADVLVEGFRPGSTERLGLGPAECAALNPGLVYARMTGWGQEGPLAARAGHDINYLAVTGALHAMGEAGGKPVVPLNLVGDFGGGSMFLLVGVLAALHERQSSGLGQVVDVAIVDGVAQLMSMTWNMRELGQWSDERGTNLLDGGAHFYATYACSDGRYVAVGAVEPQFYAQLLSGLGIEDLSQHPRDWQRGTKELAAAFSTRTRDEWEQVFAGTDACVTPVLSLAEAPYGAHLAARATLPVDERGQLRPAPAPRLSRTPGQVARAGTVEDLLARWSA